MPTGLTTFPRAWARIVWPILVTPCTLLAAAPPTTGWEATEEIKAVWLGQDVNVPADSPDGLGGNFGFVQFQAAPDSATPGEATTTIPTPDWTWNAPANASFGQSGDVSSGPTPLPAIHLERDALMENLDLSQVVQAPGLPVDLSQMPMEHYLPQEGTTSLPFLGPGRSTLLWSPLPQDAANPTVREGYLQEIYITPEINFYPDQSASAGDRVVVRAVLDGQAANYPVVIPYQVGGSAIAEDHDLIDGELVIESGRHGDLVVNVAADVDLSTDKTIEITLGETSGIQAGAKILHRITLSSTAGAPPLAMQLNVTASAQANALVIEPYWPLGDRGVTWRYEWHPSDGVSPQLSEDGRSMTLDPTTLAMGEHMQLLVARAGDRVRSALGVVYVSDCEQSTPCVSLASLDSALPDPSQRIRPGWQIWNGLRPLEGMKSYGQELKLGTYSGELLSPSWPMELIRTEPGLSIRGGESAQAATDGANEFDIVVSELSQAGDSVWIYLSRLRNPFDEVKLNEKDFIADDHNQVLSASADSNGTCDLLPTSAYETGLGADHDCLAIQLQDGGLYDKDGVADGRVAVTVFASMATDNKADTNSATLPDVTSGTGTDPTRADSNSSSSAGAAWPGTLPGLALLLLMLRRRACMH